MAVRFLLDGETVAIDDVGPTDTALDLLRYRLRRTGTKEGCAEGDCGACTILVGSLEDEGIVWRAVNACIQFVPMLHGKAVLTVESLAEGGVLNPLQACMAQNGSSQCGFCTPGFVMALYGRAIGARGSELPLADGLAGNLCRCTGYGPILAAGEAVASLPRDDTGLTRQLAEMAGDGASGSGATGRWFAPRSVAELGGLLRDYPDARMVAGATDVGLWVTKGLRELETVIFLGDIAELDRIEETPGAVEIGAGVRYADAHAALARLHPDLGELVRRIGGVQVRSAGTIGGNIANGSPIGDGPPAFIALGATLRLRSASGVRTIPLEDFFIAYGKQDLRPGEFVEAVIIPRPSLETIVSIAKLSRRFDSDISAVCGAFAITVTDGTITGARIAFGGMAATPKRASACEAALTGKPFAAGTIEAAARALATDYQPLSDVRGTSAYRLEAAANLLRRLWLREQGHAVSVLEMDAIDG